MKHFLPALLLVAVAAGADEPQAPLPPVTSPPSVTGQSPAAPTRESSRLRAEIRSVIDSDEFHERKTVTTPVLRDWLRDITARWRTPSRGTPGKISTAIDFNLLARLFKYGEAILLVAAVAWLLWKGRQWLPSRLSRRTDPKNFPLPPDSHSTAMAASDLPTRVSAAARAAWASGDATTALSLLYRGAVRDLGEHYDIMLPDSATEGECLRQAQRGSAPVIRAAFSPIVKAWMAQAYADCPPDDFAALVALYEIHFEPPGGATR